MPSVADRAGLRRPTDSRATLSHPAISNVAALHARGAVARLAARAVERRLGLSGAELVYVADNAAKDFLAPRRLGWATVQIRRPGALHAGPPATPEFGADRSIDSLDQLDPG